MSFPALSQPAIAAIGCLAACLTALVSAGGMFLVRGSTAVPAACWAVVGCLALAGDLGARACGGLADHATEIGRAHV